MRIDHSISFPTPSSDDIKQMYPALFAEISLLDQASDAEFAQRFPAFVAQIERDFAIEEQWMEEMQFAALRHHRNQHAELLRLLHHTQERIWTGNFTLARKIMSLLPPWFDFHISQMDVMWAVDLHKKTSIDSAMPVLQAA